MRALGYLLAGSMLLLARPAAAIDIQDITSPGGIHAWLVEDHSTKVISLDFAIRCGSACDPADKQGISVFATSLLDEGAGPYDSGTYQGKLADLSASIEFNAGDDEISGGLQTLSSTRDEVFDLLRLALTEPRFDAQAVERIRAEIGQEIDAELQNPGALAGHLINQTEFPGHPYGQWASGSKSILAKFTTDDLHGFVKTRLTRDRLLISVVGDITPAELGPLLDKSFGGLTETATVAEPADVKPAAASEILVIKKPNPQSVIRFAQPGIGVHDPDLFAAMVMNRILGGGGLTSRLSQEVREKRGLAYGIGTGLAFMDHANLISGSVATQDARVGETLAVVRAQWAKMRDEGPTVAEVADAKTYLNGSYTIGLTNSGAIAQRLLGLQEEKLGIDYIDRRPKLISSVTPDDVKRIARQLLDPSKLVFAVVGDPATLPDGKVVDATH